MVYEPKLAQATREAIAISRIKPMMSASECDRFLAEIRLKFGVSEKQSKQIVADLITTGRLEVKS